jgi:hypothetical protein
MLLLLWLVLCLVGVSVSLLPLALRRLEVYKQYSGIRLVVCPENQQAAAVGVDSRHAAATAIDGTPRLRLCECSRWPDRANCAQACLSQALQPGPETSGGVKVATKQIYHLPIILAAFVAWVLGAIWHSQWLFRTRWIDAAGLTRAQIKQMVWWLSPHLLTAAICLLFAYGVAWLLAVSHRRGVLSGVLVSLLLGWALVGASWYSLAGLPHGLLVIEAGYAALATLIVGAIVGGLYNKSLLPSQ